MNLLLSLTTAALLLVPQHTMPEGMTHEEHLKKEQLKQRGADAMGFDQDATAHRFTITPEGGSIEVTVKDPRDTAMLAAVRSHLRSIADDFALGRFDKPFQTHGEMPPGVPAMQAHRASIAYRYQDLPNGGAVRIITRAPEARDAVHAFLRYQIQEHQP